MAASNGTGAQGASPQGYVPPGSTRKGKNTTQPATTGSTTARPSETLGSQSIGNGDIAAAAHYSHSNGTSPSATTSPLGIGLAQPIRNALGISQQLALLLSTAAFAIAVVALVLASGRRGRSRQRLH